MKISKIFLVLIFFVSCTNSEKQKIDADLVRSPFTALEKSEEVEMPIIQVNTDTYDFLEINQGESVDVEFIVTNVGDAPLLIRSAKGSCGCTVPQWPKDPIPKGEIAKIKVRFNSAGKKGLQNKKVTLITNAIPSAKVLTIKGNVLDSK